MQILLPPQLANIVSILVAQGRYADESEVIRDAIRRLAEQLGSEPGAIGLRAELQRAEAAPTFSVVDMLAKKKD